MEKPRKTLRQVAENPRQGKGTSEPEREGARPKEHRRPQSDRRTSQTAKEHERKKRTEEAASDKKQG